MLTYWAAKILSDTYFVNLIILGLQLISHLFFITNTYLPYL